MVRIVGLQTPTPELKAAIARTAGACDEAVLLPGAYVSPESGTAKNVVFCISGDAKGLSPDLFSERLFEGVSLIQLTPTQARHALRVEGGERRLSALTAAVMSETADAELTIGPTLDGDDRDCDVQEWACGFDSTSCVAGVYASTETVGPTAAGARHGFARAHTTHYLVVRAGAGLAASQFLSRLRGQMASGASLEQALGEGGTPGASGLRRLQRAGERNRARLLLCAAAALGLDLDSIGDTAAMQGGDTGARRLAIVSAACSANTLRRMDMASPTYLYASGACDALFCHRGVVSCSSAADGMVLMTPSGTGHRAGGAPVVSVGQRLVMNDAHDCVPFCSPRLVSDRDCLTSVIDAMLVAPSTDTHPDGVWVREHFGWRNPSAGDGTRNTIPLALSGTHTTDRFLDHARELALDGMWTARLHPELCVVPGMQASRLRMLHRATAPAAVVAGT